MIMKRMPSALLLSAFLRSTTPRSGKPLKSKLAGFVDSFFQAAYDNFVYYPGVDLPSQPLSETDIEPTKNIVDLFEVLKPKFNPGTDLLLISKTDLEEARTFDADGWIDSIAGNTVVLGEDLKNIAIVRNGYSNNLF